MAIEKLFVLNANAKSKVIEQNFKRNVKKKVLKHFKVTEVNLSDHIKFTLLILSSPRFVQQSRGSWHQGCHPCFTFFSIFL